MMEVLICHPLPNEGPIHFISSEKSIMFCIRKIYQRSPMAFYRGLGAVMVGIMPKMAIRFTSFETYKAALTKRGENTPSLVRLFVAGLAAGMTEAVLVVTPTEVIKIRLQTAGKNYGGSLPIGYRTAPEAYVTTVRTEGIWTLWRGVSLTAARQGTNQAGTSNSAKTDSQPQYQSTGLPPWQTALSGFLAGSLGPLANAPLDTLKTQIQKSSQTGKTSSASQVSRLFQQIVQNEGYMALYKGTLPRVLRVGVGQSVTFMTYELLRKVW
ncbi:mitochondrial carrier domain-containing protein [Talaromyces proteolyticus]|uniref:Mitochondrial carrier domain-containing protein n=1 Tax=Talaromyces proteolyticus TaxID=1131652 RepID=A0AAD4PVJ8_9EURO|nr:mitochondrial carrier domain-containing protein [Talaromyces proteolyticus]KAH8690445.1 mitochondrial carrier domain-containing protein [Talaromyces proteolyticus]